MVNVSEREKSEFNAASDYVRDIERFFIDAGKSLAQRNYQVAYDILGSVAIMISGEMKPTELQHFNEEYIRLNNLFTKYQFAIRKGQYPADLVNQLRIYAIELFKLWKDSGLQNKAIKDKRFSANYDG